MKISNKIVRYFSALFALFIILCVPERIVRAGSSEILGSQVFCCITGNERISIFGTFQSVSFLLPHANGPKEHEQNKVHEPKTPDHEKGQAQEKPAEVPAPDKAAVPNEKIEAPKMDKHKNDGNNNNNNQPVYNDYDPGQNYPENNDDQPQEQLPEETAAETTIEETTISSETTVSESSGTTAGAENDITQAMTTDDENISEEIVSTSDNDDFNSKFNSGFMKSVTIISLIVFVILSGVFVVWLQKMI